MDVGGVGGEEHKVYGVRRLPNINTETNVITQYRLTNDKPREIIEEFLLDASNCRNLAMSQTKHEELQALITEINQERQAVLEVERDADKERLELRIQSQLFRLCWQSLARWISDEYEGYMVCPDNFRKRTATLRPYVRMCAEVDTQ